MVRMRPNASSAASPTKDAQALTQSSFVKGRVHNPQLGFRLVLQNALSEVSLFFLVFYFLVFFLLFLFFSLIPSIAAIDASSAASIIVDANLTIVFGPAAQIAA